MPAHDFIYSSIRNGQSNEDARQRIHGRADKSTQFGADVNRQRLLKSNGKQSGVIVFKRLHKCQGGNDKKRVYIVINYNEQRSGRQIQRAKTQAEPFQKCSF